MSVESQSNPSVFQKQLPAAHRFEEQAAAWLEGLRQRKRKPISPCTLTTYQAHVARLAKFVSADTLLADIDNGTLKRLANELQGSAKTIQETLMALRAIVASAMDPQTGEQIYPRQWNHAFIDAPTVENQRQPCVTGDDVTRAIRESRTWSEQLLYVILAGTGLRISEALAIRVGPVNNDQTSFLEDQGVIEVRATIFENKEYPGKVKTAASKRDVDLDPRLPSRIAEFIRAHKIAPGSFLFQSENGAVANLETLTRRLRQRLPHFGFHAFRRFRLTHLRKARIPEDLIQGWIGHSPSSISDLYDKAMSDLEYRKHWSKAAGLGFDLQHLSFPQRLRKKRSRIERMQAMLKNDVKPPVYVSSDEDLPSCFFAPKEVCID
jgi:integrase